MPDTTFPTSYNTISSLHHSNIAFLLSPLVPVTPKPRMRSPGPDSFNFMDDDELPPAPSALKKYQDLDWSVFMFTDDTVAEQILHGADTYGANALPETTITHTGAHSQHIGSSVASAEVPHVALSTSFLNNPYGSNDPGPSRYAGQLRPQNAGLPPTVAYALDWGSDQNHTAGAQGVQLPSLTGPIRTQVGRIKRRKVEQSMWSLVSDGHLLTKGSHY